MVSHREADKGTESFTCPSAAFRSCIGAVLHAESVVERMLIESCSLAGSNISAGCETPVTLHPTADQHISSLAIKPRHIRMHGIPTTPRAVARQKALAGSIETGQESRAFRAPRCHSIRNLIERLKRQDAARPTTCNHAKLLCTAPFNSSRSPRSIRHSISTQLT